jgi:hypothetical protein
MPGSVMLRKAPTSKGTFVHCLVDAAGGVAAAKQRLRCSLLEDAYEVLSFGDVMNFQTYRAKAEVTDEMVRAASKIGVSGGVWYSAFAMTNDPGKCICLSPHELLFVDKFLIPERRGRWLDALASPKRRHSFMSRLADSRDFVPERMHPVAPVMQTATAIERLLRSLGAPEHCYVLSQLSDADGKLLPLGNALETVVGLGLGTALSCIPGRLLYYEEETPGKRWTEVGGENKQSQNNLFKLNRQQNGEDNFFGLAHSTDLDGRPHQAKTLPSPLEGLQSGFASNATDRHLLGGLATDYPRLPTRLGWRRLRVWPHAGYRRYASGG